MQYVSPEGLEWPVGVPRRFAVSTAWLILAPEIAGGNQRTMEVCILTHLMPHSQIDIYVQLLQADGGKMKLCAGYLNSTPLLDLNYVEDSAGGPDVTLGILPKLDKMDSKLPIDILENVMQLAIEGCKAIANHIREVLLENTKQLEYRRGV
ncbi:hypothetical protein L6164_003980 [Bauhinia variegata]|uniref:Uncharacterized protein n=1 Tax=Bauhinia variegata TaxID=167791 RepID=A0ACB9Q3K8_BAUVA|nr:hypothetical protein L6164_003980 [Bauhinia variegata]